MTNMKLLISKLYLYDTFKPGITDTSSSLKCMDSVVRLVLTYLTNQPTNISLRIVVLDVF